MNESLIWPFRALEDKNMHVKTMFAKKSWPFRRTLARLKIDHFQIQRSIFAEHSYALSYERTKITFASTLSIRYIKCNSLGHVSHILLVVILIRL